MIQFYSPDIESTLKLPESDSGHCVRVLRHQIGDVIDVIDGCGNMYKCKIIDAHPKHVGVEIIEKSPIPLPWDYNVTIAVAPTKLMDRMEWMVEKLTEIGVNSIVLLLCEHSERREIKRERLIKTAVSAMKQSLKSVLPDISEMTNLSTFINQLDDSCDKFVAYCDKDMPRTLLATEIKPKHDTIILIGPEGDFSPSEVKMLIENGFKAVSLGDCRLRTETAAINSCDTIHIINQINNLI